MYIHFMFTAGMVVARVHLNRLDTHAYTECFRMLFATVKKDHTKFAVGESLLGDITDWSDQQINGLAEVVVTMHCTSCTCVYRTLELICVPHQ